MQGVARKLPGNQACSYTLPFGPPKIKQERGPRPPVHPSYKFPSLAPGSRFGFGNNRTKEEVAGLRETAIRHKHSTHVDELHLGQRGLASIPSLRSFIGLQVLWLNGNQLTDSTGLHHAKRLRALYLHDNKIEDVGEDIVGLKYLQKLNLAHNDIRLLDPVVNKLKKLLFLTELDLTGNPVTKLLGYRETLIKAMPQLHLLDAMLVTDDDRAAISPITNPSRNLKSEWKPVQRMQRDFKPRSETKGIAKASFDTRRSQSAQGLQGIPDRPTIRPPRSMPLVSGQLRTKKKLEGCLYINCTESAGDAGAHALPLDAYVHTRLNLAAQAKADEQAKERHNFSENFRAETRAVMERLSKPEFNVTVPRRMPPVETKDMSMSFLEQMESQFKAKALVPECLGTARDFNNISPVSSSEPTVSYEDACSLVRERLTKREEGQVPHPPDECLVKRLAFQMAVGSTPPRPGLPEGPTPGNVDWLCFLCIMAQHLRLRLPKQYVDSKSQELLGKRSLDHHHSFEQFDKNGTALVCTSERARRSLDARHGGIVQHYQQTAEKFAQQENLALAAEMAAIHSTAAMVCVRKEQQLQAMASFQMDPLRNASPPHFDHVYSPQVDQPAVPMAPHMGVGGMMTLPSTRYPFKCFTSTGFIR